MNSIDSTVSLVQPASSVNAAPEGPAQVPSPFAYDPFVADYIASAADRDALEEAQLAPVNLDVQEIIPVVLGAARRINTLRSEIVDQMPRFDIARFDSIVPLTQSLAYAHSLYLSASTPPQDLPRLFARAVELREILVLDVTGLVKRGLVAGAPLNELKGAVGYANVASDLRVLTNIYQATWSVIEGKTAVQSSELNEAALLFRQMTGAVAERTQQSSIVAAAANQRQRAYTLVLRAYDDARRAVAYLRSEEGDADKLAPSLWKGRGRRNSADNSENAAPIGPAPSPVVAGGAPSNAPPVAPVAPGMPGGSPFIEG